MDDLNCLEDILSRVLDLEEVRSYRCQGPLHVALPRGSFTFMTKNPVPVIDDGGRRLGFACLFLDGGGVVDADIFLTRESPERLDLEQGLRLYCLVPSDVAVTFSKGSGLSLSPTQEIDVRCVRLTSYVDGREPVR